MACATTTTFASALGAVALFVLLSLPMTYSATARVFPGAAKAGGAPTPWGVFVHSVIYLAILWVYLYLWAHTSQED